MTASTLGTNTMPRLNAASRPMVRLVATNEQSARWSRRIARSTVWARRRSSALRIGLERGLSVVTRLASSWRRRSLMRARRLLAFSSSEPVAVRNSAGASIAVSRG